MFEQGERVVVKDPDGSGWIAAHFLGVAVGEPRHINHPGVNDGRGYNADQFRVRYLEGDHGGTFGLHILTEIRHPDAAPN